jgi:hypothetical protein
MKIIGVTRWKWKFEHERTVQNIIKLYLRDIEIMFLYLKIK